MHIPSLVKTHWCLLKLSSGNENMGVTRADKSVKIWRNLPISNSKPDLHNINAHTKFGEKSIDFYSSYHPEMIYGRTDVRLTDGQTDTRPDVQHETIIPRHYRVGVAFNLFSIARNNKPFCSGTINRWTGTQCNKNHSKPSTSKGTIHTYRYTLTYRYTVTNAETVSSVSCLFHKRWQLLSPELNTRYLKRTRRTVLGRSVTCVCVCGGGGGVSGGGGRTVTNNVCVCVWGGGGGEEDRGC